jgi:hypothetical protein
MAAIEGAIDIQTIGEDTYSVMLAVAFGGSGSAKTIVGIKNVDVLLRAIGVPRTARTKAIEEVKTRRAGSTGIVQLYGDELRRLGLM